MARSRLGFIQRGASSGIAVVISSNQTNYSLFSGAGSPGAAVNVTLTINSGVVVYSTSTATPALDLSGFPSGSTITVINNGSIIGKGGNGGAGGNGHNVSGTAGSAGGDAIKLGTNNVTINNASGSIFGGGGGGGGGGGAGQNVGSGTKYDPVVTWGYGGGGGGGGQSYSATSGGSGGGTGGWSGSGGSTGGAGSNSSAGSGASGGSGYATAGTGGNGGGYGAAGSSGASGSGTFGGSGAGGGAAGKAVALNGRSVTWTAGNNSTQVKGAQS